METAGTDSRTHEIAVTEKMAVINCGQELVIGEEGDQAVKSPNTSIYNMQDILDILHR